MPEYTYTDGTTTITVNHPMEWEGQIIGGTGVPCWRMPSHIAAVHWAELPCTVPVIKDNNAGIRRH